MKKTKEFVVYKITNIDSGKSYIGITVDYKRRMKEHFDYHYNCDSYLHRSIKKYGKNQFSHEIIYKCDNWNSLCKKEIKYIKIFNTKMPNGYNFTNGGEGVIGLKWTEEQCKRSSEAKKELWTNDEYRKKMSESHKGVKFSNETRKKMSESHQNISNETRKKLSESWENRSPISDETRKKMSIAKQNMSDETRKKMSESQKGKKHSLETRKKMSIIAQNMSGKHRKKISEAKRKFSTKDVLKIRQLLLNGVYQYKIANEFKVTQAAISFIKQNKRYAEIQLQ